MIQKPGTFLLLAAMLGLLASGCKNAPQSSRGKEPPLLTKTLNVAMGNVNTALAICDFTSAGCAKAVSVVLNVDDRFLVESLAVEGR